MGAVCTKQCSKCMNPFKPHYTPMRRILLHSIYKVCKPRHRGEVTCPSHTAGPVSEPDFSRDIDFRACAHNHGAIVPLWVCLQTQSKSSCIQRLLPVQLHHFNLYFHCLLFNLPIIFPGESIMSENFGEPTQQSAFGEVLGFISNLGRQTRVPWSSRSSIGQCTLVP